jgi:DNA-binding winged helix-turn-helix (wHTH) protein
VASRSFPQFCREFQAFTGTGDAAIAPVAERSRAETPASVYRFGRCRLDKGSRELTRDDRLAAIEHRAFDLLVYLIEHRDRAISKDELQEAIWPRMILTESALTRCVMRARRAVGDDPQLQRVIKTVHGHGYRFVAPLAGVPPAARAEPATS